MIFKPCSPNRLLHLQKQQRPRRRGIAIDAIAGFQFVLVNTLIYANQSTVTDPAWLFGVGGVMIRTGDQMMAPAPNNPKIINCTIANNTAAHSVKVGGVAVNLTFGRR